MQVRSGRSEAALDWQAACIPFSGGIRVCERIGVPETSQPACYVLAASMLKASPPLAGYQASASSGGAACWKEVKNACIAAEPAIKRVEYCCTTMTGRRHAQTCSRAGMLLLGLKELTHTLQGLKSSQWPLRCREIRGRLPRRRNPADERSMHPTTHCCRCPPSRRPAGDGAWCSTIRLTSDNHRDYGRAAAAAALAPQFRSRAGALACTSYSPSSARQPRTFPLARPWGRAAPRDSTRLDVPRPALRDAIPLLRGSPSAAYSPGRAVGMLWVDPPAPLSC